jgi:hypothetical protein
MSSKRPIAAPLVTAALVSFVCAGCTHKTRAPPPASAAAPENLPTLMRSACAMEVPGTTVESEDVEEGASLVFKTTSEANVEDLRTHARRLAERHNLHGTIDDRTPGRSQASELREGLLGVTSTASVEDVDGGSRVVFHPHDPEMLEALRRRVQVRAEHMIPGRCR